MKAVKLHPFTFMHVSEELRHDFDLITMATAGSSTPLERYLRENRTSLDDRNAFIAACIQKANERIETAETFFKTILCGISFANLNCPLRLLDQGTETRSCFEDLIAQYVHVPSGEQVHLIRRALSNLRSLAEESDDDDE